MLIRTPLLRLALALASTVGTEAIAGSVITVNSSAWTKSVDGVMTLREAVLLGRGSWNSASPDGLVNIYCFSSAEKAQVSGANWVAADPTEPGCAYTNPPTIDRWVPVNDVTNNPNVGSNYADDIVFDNSVTTITPSFSLVLARNDDLDGLRPAGGNVLLQGPGSGGWAGDGIIAACCFTGSVIRNLYIVGFNGDGISAPSVNGLQLQRLWIEGNVRYGVELGGGVDKVTNAEIGGLGFYGSGDGNAIFGNGLDGVRISDANADTSARNNRLRGNYIGLDPDDQLGAHGNVQHGIAIVSSPGNLIGTGEVGGGNLVYGNGQLGIVIAGSAASGNKVFGNTFTKNSRGIQIQQGANQNRIGDGNAGEANVVAANINHGIYVDGAGTNYNIVQFNTVGLNALQNGATPNGQDGILVGGGAQNNTLQNNVISGNTRWGIYIGGTSVTGTLIQNNVIGLKKNGASTAANGIEAGNGLGGLWIDSAPSTVVGVGNTIAGNNGPGVQISGEDADNTIVKNNRIGLNGINELRGNLQGGVLVTGGADGAQIGGSAALQNIISGNSGDGIRFDNAASTSGKVIGNRIGTDSGGTAARRNTGAGIHVFAASGVQIDANLISGNGNDGVSIGSGAFGVTMQGNVVGVNVSGTATLPNAASGIALLSGAHDNTIGSGAFNAVAGNAGSGVFVADTGTHDNTISGNVIGGSGLPNGAGITVTASAANTVISNNVVCGNTGDGVWLTGGAQGTLMSGNTIGLNASGVATPNARGLRIDGGAGNSGIGGAPVASRNIMSGNSQYGVGLIGVSNNLLVNNYIGTTINGSAAAANGEVGVLISAGATGNTLLKNLISGNVQSGLRLTGAGTLSNSIQGNLIGSNAAFSAALPNGQDGIRIDSNASGNTIGVGTAGGFNQIGYNLGAGIAVQAGVDNPLRYNRLVANAGLGIDLGSTGVNANDANDVDSGANDLQNHPVLSNVIVGLSSTSLAVTLNSTPSSAYTIDFYTASPCDASGYGESDAWLTSIALNTAASGTGFVNNVILPLANTSTHAAWGSATATSALGSTSELGPCVAISDRIFGNGFQAGSGLRPALLAKPASDAQRAVDAWPGLRLVARAEARSAIDIEVLAWLINDSAEEVPAQTVLINASDAVIAAENFARSGSCRVAGDIRCEVAAIPAHGSMRIAVTLQRVQPQPLQIAVDVGDTEHSRARQVLDVPAAIGR
ncbi:MAG: right-handed parallel beta-helix repeat-containing protein [Tahibacter sp.]